MGSHPDSISPSRLVVHKPPYEQKGNGFGGGCNGGGGGGKSREGVSRRGTVDGSKTCGTTRGVWWGLVTHFAGEESGAHPVTVGKWRG